jgi:DoxX-like family
LDTAVHLGVLIVEGLLALFLAYAVYLNFSSAPMLMKQYTALRLPRWYTLLAGVLLSIGAIALLVGLVIPAIGALATLWMVAYFVVATLTHVVRKDKLTAVATPVAFLALFVALAVLRWAHLAPLLATLHIG